MDHSTSERRCTQCGESFPATTEFFYRQSAKKDGFNPICKACINAKQNAYRAANPELIRQRKKADYERNKEKYIKRAAEWQDNHKDLNNERARKKWAAKRDELNARKRELRAARRDEYNARSQKWKEANRDKLNERGRKRYHEGEGVKARQIVHGHMRRARKAGLPNNFTLDDWQKALDYFNGCCAACGRPAGLFHTIAQDHWFPLSLPDSPGTVPGNIIPLCNGRGGCNNSKRDKDPYIWLVWKFGKRKGEDIAAKIQAYFDTVIIIS